MYGGLERQHTHMVVFNQLVLDHDHHVNDHHNHDAPPLLFDDDQHHNGRPVNEHQQYDVDDCPDNDVDHYHNIAPVRMQLSAILWHGGR
jgi:hypothetical protein